MSVLLGNENLLGDTVNESLPILRVFFEFHQKKQQIYPETPLFGQKSQNFVHFRKIVEQDSSKLLLMEQLHTSITKVLSTAENRVKKFVQIAQLLCDSEVLGSPFAGRIIFSDLPGLSLSFISHTHTHRYVHNTHTHTHAHR